MNSRNKHQTYRIDFINHVAGSAIIEATSKEEALEILRRNECEFSDPSPLDSEVVSIEVVHG